MLLRITRTIKQTKQTLGKLEVLNDKGDVVFNCFTLELPYLSNRQKISCIPTGVYDVEKRFSDKYGSHFHVLDVPNRDMILIHNGNYYTQILGCILVGKDLIDLNKDGLKDVTESKKTLEKLSKLMPHNFKLYII